MNESRLQAAALRKLAEANLIAATQLLDDRAIEQIHDRSLSGEAALAGNQVGDAVDKTNHRRVQEALARRD